MLPRPNALCPMPLCVQVTRRPHSWSLCGALGALEVFDLDPKAEYRTVVTTRRTEAGDQDQAARMMKVPLDLHNKAGSRS